MKNKIFDLKQIKYGMRHPLKSYVKSVKGEAYDKVPPNSNVSSMPIGHIILASPFLFLIFLHFETNISFKTLLIILAKTFIISSLLMMGIGQIGMTINSFKTDYSVKKGTIKSRIIICTIFFVIGFSGFLITWRLGLFVLTISSVILFIFLLLHA